MTKTIGIIGYGNMGEAIASQLKAKYQVYIFDKDRNKTKNVSGIKVAKDNVDLAKKVNTLILAVKPQDFDVVLREIKDCIKRKLIISIAAGITTVHIERYLDKARVIRTMPNLPARLGRGLICLSKGKSATQKDLNTARHLFKNLGKIVLLKENMINAATAISGSGPGYLYDWAEGKTMEEIKEYVKNIFIPSLTKVAKTLGFTSGQAKALVEATGWGSIFYLQNSGVLPQELKKQVASKGGTTEAGLEVLHRGGSLKEAVRAALKRAEELSRKE